MRQLVPRLLNLVASLVIAGLVLFIAIFGYGIVPPLGSALNPGTGLWTAAAAAQLQSQTLHLQGPQEPVTVVFEQNGTAHIHAQTDNDMFWTMGYLHARFRLFQMDLLRRQGEGHLSQILGPAALDSDSFQVELGLDRIAQANWQLISTNNPAYHYLLAYAQGVNARISEDERTSSLPVMFKALNYQPRPWTPIDTLVVQGDLTQLQSFQISPLNYALMVKALGYQRTMQWFPITAADTQNPYMPGTSTSTGQPDRIAQPLPSQLALSQDKARAVSSVTQQLASLPANSIHTFSDSNNWAVNGPLTVSGQALMAGDPHLNLTLPSIWYQWEATSPDYSMSGVSVPGIPLILIGHNQHISWSLTDTQNQSTLYYDEQTDNAHPHQYYWRGSWHQMQHFLYTIPVRGAPPVHQDVYATVHGPIIHFLETAHFQNTTLAVDWLGALKSLNFNALMSMVQATNFTQFRSALQLWKAPTENFIYADDKGNIGLLAPGYYPIIKSGAPWLPLPGAGESDIIGSIPFDAVPQVYDPPNHMLFSANQRPVSMNYPYYIGTTWGYFDNGYRANEIKAELSANKALTMQSMEQIQNSTRDYLASQIVPELLNNLHYSSLTGSARQAYTLLRTWNDHMDANLSAASIWWTFWSQYLNDTFQPWWNAMHVPEITELSVSSNQVPLDEDLEAWTLHDRTNAAFTLPNGQKRIAQQVMTQAFNETISSLSKQLGSDPHQWQWGKLHTREIASLSQIEALAYGPYPAGSDTWTINSAADNLSTHGPSWRFIMDWSSHQCEGIYPGGQDENPASPWYENQIHAWWDGLYYPLIDISAARSQHGSISWTIAP